jgi:hypothetical protein
LKRAEPAYYLYGVKRQQWAFSGIMHETVRRPLSGAMAEGHSPKYALT